MRAFVKQLLPPALLPIAKRFDSGSIRYFGNYRTWQEATCRCGGYEATEILERVSSATERVLAGKAAFERDSVCFAQPDFRWPLLASLLWTAALTGGKLNVLDFGGSLGSSYLQNRPLLNGLRSVHWNIVEQRAFVERGKELFPSGQPRFFRSIEDCLAADRPSVLLLSSVLEYLPDPHAVLVQLLAYDFPFIIVDRTTFLTSCHADRLSIQTVPASIYPASYPCWFLSLPRVLNQFRSRYRLVTELPCDERTTVSDGAYRGFLFANLLSVSAIGDNS